MPPPAQMQTDCFLFFDRQLSFTPLHYSLHCKVLSNHETIMHHFNLCHVSDDCQVLLGNHSICAAKSQPCRQRPNIARCVSKNHYAPLVSISPHPGMGDVSCTHTRQGTREVAGKVVSAPLMPEAPSWL